MKINKKKRLGNIKMINMYELIIVRGKQPDWCSFQEKTERCEWSMMVSEESKKQSYVCIYVNFIQTKAVPALDNHHKEIRISINLYLEHSRYRKTRDRLAILNERWGNG